MRNCSLSCIHHQRAVSKFYCRLWASVSVERTCLNPWACISRVRGVVDVNQKMPAATMYVANCRLEKEIAREDLQNARDGGWGTQISHTPWWGQGWPTIVSQKKIWRTKMYKYVVCSVEHHDLDKHAANKHQTQRTSWSVDTPSSTRLLTIRKSITDTRKTWAYLIQCQWRDRSHLANNIMTTSRPLEMLHMNLFGPNHDKSHGGNSFGPLRGLFKIQLGFLFGWQSTCSTDLHDFCKDNTKSIWSQDKKNIRSDNGTESKNTNIEDFLDEDGILHEFSTTYTP